MDFEETQEGGFEEHIPVTHSTGAAAAGTGAPYPAPAQRPKRSGWRMVLWIMLALSVIANFFLFVILIAAAVFFAAGQKDFFAENVVRKGSLGNKIAIVRLEGIINSRLSEDMREQIKTAADDDRVKAVIIRTISPGGTVSASDRIHHEITKFRAETDKPVVAFMQGIAASGGYYTSVACDKIIAEPTTITGSIGVMSSHIVVKRLLEEKLGISSVVVKSGPKKDWPSIFEETTDEQKQYLMDKLISPTYERFVGLVNDGRGALTESQVRELADGSIYGAVEALDKRLIDQIGYIDDAIALAESLAGIENAHVIEYERPFSFTTLLSTRSESIWNMDTDAIRELAVPQLLYLWNANW
ncbi:MAG: signal peptide peptidase SppA [Planctomycetota bacterium]|nr:MAG: signal peptide peptidase SppA [Planctomycetota bacterium]